MGIHICPTDRYFITVRGIMDVVSSNPEADSQFKLSEVERGRGSGEDFKVNDIRLPITRQQKSCHSYDSDVGCIIYPFWARPSRRIT